MNVIFYLTISQTTYLHHSAVPTMMGMGNNDEMNAVEEARLLKERARSVALISREARSNQRRYASVLGDDFNELFKFSQLKLRKKHLRFARLVTGLVCCAVLSFDTPVVVFVSMPT